jgi:hypothetical protein
MVPTHVVKNTNGRPVHRLLVTVAVSAPIIFLVIVLFS